MAKTKETTERMLNAQQELFCRFYTQNEALFGNATLSYAEAYEFKLHELSEKCPLKASDAEHECNDECPPSDHKRAYDTCSVNGSRSLRNAQVQARVTALLNEVLRDEVVDSQLAKLIMQDSEPATKIAAIREYNKLRQRIVEKVEHSGEVTSKVVYLPERKNAGMDADARSKARA